MTLNSHHSGPPENRLTVVFKSSQFPPLPVCSTLLLRLQICNRHFPDSLLPAGFLLSYNCRTFWRKIGRQEESSRLSMELLMGAAIVASDRGWQHVTPAAAMGIQHPRFLLVRAKAPPGAFWQVRASAQSESSFRSLADTSSSPWHLRACQCLCNQCPAWKPSLT